MTFEDFRRLALSFPETSESAHIGNSILRTAVSGWQFSGIARVQSGTPAQLLSGRGTFNSTIDGGVVLHNMRNAQLQDMIQIRKTSTVLPNGQAQGFVFWLPQAVIDNKTVFLYGPRMTRFDLSLVKKTRVAEK